MDRFITDILFFIFLIIAMIIDIKSQIIPHKIDIGIILLGFVNIILNSLDIEMKILGMGTYPLIFLILYAYGEDIFKKEIIGFGDIKLLWSIGFYLGYDGIYSLIIYYNIIFLLSGIYGIIGKFYFKKPILPFAPIICISTIIFYFLRRFL